MFLHPLLEVHSAPVLRIEEREAKIRLVDTLLYQRNSIPEQERPIRFPPARVIIPEIKMCTDIAKVERRPYFGYATYLYPVFLSG